MKGTINVQTNEKRTDFPFNFSIVTFGDSFWREKNARLRRDTNSTLISLNF